MSLKDQYSTNLGLSVQPEIDQQKHPQIFLELMRMRNAFKILQGALDLNTGALSEDPAYWNQTDPLSSVRIQYISRIYAKAIEAISYGNTVNLTSSGGVLAAQKASATDTTKPARAVCVTTGGVALGAYGEFILQGVVPGFSSLTPGTLYYLGTAVGSWVSTMPVVTGNLQQEVGFAVSPSEIYFNPSLKLTAAP